MTISKTCITLLAILLSDSAFSKGPTSSANQSGRKPSAEAYEWQENFKCSASKIIANKNTNSPIKFQLKPVGQADVAVKSVPDGANFKNLKVGEGTLKIDDIYSIRFQINLSQAQDFLVNVVGKPDLLQIYSILIETRSGKTEVMTRTQSKSFGDSANGDSFEGQTSLINPQVLTIAMKQKHSLFPEAGDGFDIAPISDLIEKGLVKDKSLLSIHLTCTTFSTKPGGGWGF